MEISEIKLFRIPHTCMIIIVRNLGSWFGGFLSKRWLIPITICV